MGVVIAGISAIVFIIIAAMYVIAKMLNVEKLFAFALLSFLFFTILSIVPTYIFLDIGKQEANANTSEEETLEVFPEEKPFAIVNDEGTHEFFSTFHEAVAAAKTQHTPSAVYLKSKDTVVWDFVDGLPISFLQVPLILQFPELPRGASVTSLAMMLQYAGVDGSKMELAEKIDKDPTPLMVENGQVFFGNPNSGFVGNMYSFELPGYSVYHKPIRKLAEIYLPNRIVDMTGAQFEDILYPIHKGSPVWVIVHTQFKELPNDAFQIWNTPSGEIKITHYQHAVLITGYDDHYVYFNDPLSTEVNRPVPIVNFEKAWRQMGAQAISYVQEGES